MLQARSIRVSLACALVASALIITAIPLRAAAPTAPTNLTAVVNGQTVTLTWTASANSPTQYTLLAGFAPGQTVATFALSGSTTSFQATAGPGTYYVRVIASNADGSSAASNEVTVVVTSSCSAPGAAFNFRAIQKGTEIFLFWRTGAGASAYSVQAGSVPGQTLVQFDLGGTSMNAAVPSGSYFARVITRNGCGSGPATPDIPVSFPSNSVRVSDPQSGTVLGMPDVQGLVNRYANQNPPTLSNSCPTGRKYEPNPWLNGLVDFLRTYDTRFGYNQKPTKTSVDNNGFPVIAAGDEFTFFAGAGTAEGSTNVYAFDVLFNHCDVARGGQPVVDYRNISPEQAIWTGAGRFTGDPQ